MCFNYLCRFDDCVEGGESVFVDGYHEVTNLKEQYPEYFNTLTHVPYSVHRIHDSLDQQ